MGKWLAGVAAAVLSAVIVWWITKPPSPVAPYSVGGVWNYRAVSEVSHQQLQGVLRLTMEGSIVSGEMENTFDNSKSGLHGTFANDVLELSRDTGLETVQNYTLRKLGTGKFSGEFRNIGKYPDKGTIEIER
jgi:hypothetical protein